MKLKTLFENKNLLALEKPSGIAVYKFIKDLLKNFPNLKNVGSAPRYGLIHRLDKETSGILLIAKNDKALRFFQKQFKERKVLKKYTALVIGKVKRKKRRIETLLGRHPKNGKKQKAFLPLSPEAKGKRWAKTLFKVNKRFKDYTLLEVMPITGRRHQVRVHLAFISHPLAGDKLYGFKNQPCPKNLKRLFLHANYIRIKGLKGKNIEIKTKLPKKLKKTLEKLK